MQTQTTQTQTAPPNLGALNNSEIIVTKTEDKKFVAVFFIGDWLTNAQKQAAGYRLGGKLFPEAKTVPNNFVNRCAITPLKQGMLSVHSGLIEKGERRNYIKEYRLTNAWNPGAENADGTFGRYEDLMVGRSGASASLLFKPIYPVQELGQIAGRNDGVVYVPGLNSNQDVKDAQMHYFPNWVRILRGEERHPTRIKELEDLIGERRAETNDEAMRQVGDAILQSAANYRIFGKAYIDYQTSVIKDAEKIPGVVQRYDEIAERLFDELEFTRQDSLIADFARRNNQAADTTDKLTEAISLLAKSQAAKQETVAQPSADIKTLTESVAALAQMTAALLQNQANAPAAVAAAPPLPQNEAEFEQSLTVGDVVDQKTAEDDKTKGKNKNVTGSVVK
ncbi:MAG TPA: hypothetical protein VNI84_12185 [Pyrinomonadaceae bacterium]|nr:hypothetical protein [Pyrinomonadaceae bacterium]